MGVLDVRFARDLLWNWVIKTRTILLQKRVIAGLQRQAHSDLAAQDLGLEHANIIENDVLIA